jgi:hypothetical protein
LNWEVEDSPLVEGYKHDSVQAYLGILEMLYS